MYSWLHAKLHFKLSSVIRNAPLYPSEGTNVRIDKEIVSPCVQKNSEKCWIFTAAAQLSYIECFKRKYKDN